MKGDFTMTDTYQPQKLWGLDPHFRSCLKLYISQILEAPYDSPYKGVFAYKNHPFYKVNVMGVVVAVDERNKCNTYSVDDGTGVITCVVWNNQPDNYYSLRRLPGLMLKKLSELQVAKEYELGDMLHVCGKLKIFRHMREVVASYHNSIMDPSAEVHRIKDLTYLHEHFYNKLFTLSKPLQEQQSS